MLRLLENDQVSPDEVEATLHDALEYYLASSTEAGVAGADCTCGMWMRAGPCGLYHASISAAVVVRRSCVGNSGVRG